MHECTRRDFVGTGLKMAGIVFARPVLWAAAAGGELLAGCSSSPKFDKSTGLMIDDKGQLKLSKPLYQCYLESGKIALATELPSGERARITYWKEGDRSHPQTVELNPGWDKVHFAIPENVEASEKYSCQLEIDGYTSSLFEFTPGVKENAPFKFLAIGDTRPGVDKPHREVVEQMEKVKDAAFYVHLGDFVNEYNPMSDWNAFFNIHERLLSRIPILPVIGNHDLSKPMYFSGLFLMKARSKEPKRYYGVTYGNLKLITLDSNVAIEKDDEQYEFFVEQLKDAKEKKLDHIVVALHYPLYSSGNHGVNKYLADTLSPVMEEYGVKLVLSGHDHHYERSKKINGIVYVVSGGGGSTLRNVEPQEFTAKGVRTYHFVEFEVAGKDMKMTAINHKGDIIDRYVF